MHYHDCFVRGCDGSVLLDSVPGKPVPEKSNRVNSLSLRGFEVIGKAKAETEAACPGIVSCADILAFAARDSVINAEWIAYSVPSGHKHGCVSLSHEVNLNLPSRSSNAVQLSDNFTAKGLSLDEMVTLSGAHSIGVSHCSSFSNRLGSINTSGDPSLDPSYAAFLRTQCPTPSSDGNPVVNNDFQTPTFLDKKYYANLEQKKGLLTSHQTLYTSPLTRKHVKINAKYGAFWEICCCYGAHGDYRCPYQ